jgi:hypothetical protein
MIGMFLQPVDQHSALDMEWVAGCLMELGALVAWVAVDLSGLLL